MTINEQLRGDHIGRLISFNIMLNLISDDVYSTIITGVHQPVNGVIDEIKRNVREQAVL